MEVPPMTSKKNVLSAMVGFWVSLTITDFTTTAIHAENAGQRWAEHLY
jgi:hypothetical protein